MSERSCGSQCTRKTSGSTSSSEWISKSNSDKRLGISNVTTFLANMRVKLWLRFCCLLNIRNWYVSNTHAVTEHVRLSQFSLLLQPHINSQSDPNDEGQASASIHLILRLRVEMKSRWGAGQSFITANRIIHGLTIPLKQFYLASMIMGPLDLILLSFLCSPCPALCSSLSLSLMALCTDS